MKKSLLLTLLTVCGLAQDQPRPYSIKADQLGESLSTYRQNNSECAIKDKFNGRPNFYHVQGSEKWSGMCNALGRPLDQLDALPLSATTDISYADRQMKAKTVVFSEDRLVSLAFSVEHDDYVSLHDNLIAKFGEPTNRSTESLQNRMGAIFTGEVLVWDNGVSTIRLKEYSGDLNTSHLRFALNDYLKEQDEFQKSRTPSLDM